MGISIKLFTEINNVEAGRCENYKYEYKSHIITMQQVDTIYI